MEETKRLHSIQMNILKVLMFKPQVRFTDLNIGKVSHDQFNFHLKRLIELGLVEKNNKNLYQLTSVGKEFANRFDVESSEVLLEKQAKIGVLVGCIGGEGKNRRYLVQQRLKQPYFGFYGFISGKTRWGEVIEDAAKRELKEEAGLEAKISLVGVKHKMDYNSQKELLEDKYFFVFKGEKPRGKLIESFEGGKNFWFKKSEIEKLPELFDGVDEIIRMLNRSSLVFSESKYKVARY